jgi:TonB family protein
MQGMTRNPDRRLTLVLIICVTAAVWQVHGAWAQPAQIINWTPVRPMQGISVTEDTLRMESSGWVISTPATLDFVLRLQFRAMTDNAEGAVLLRASPEIASGRPYLGYRVAVHGRDVRRPVGDITAIGNPVRPVLIGAPPAASTTGDWRDLEIRVEFKRLTVAIDGREAYGAELPDVFAGYTGLENERGTLEFRHVTIEHLPQSWDCARAQPLIGSPRRLDKSVPGLTAPKLRRSVRPYFPPSPFERGVQGVVRLEGVVLPNGSVGEVCILRTLDPDLDVAAAAAAKQFQFDPASQDGAPVPMLVTFEIEFKIGK